MELPKLADLKIGVLFTVYNCEPYLKDCLDPWFELKDKYNIIFAATSGMFSDYHTLKIPYRNEETLKILSNYDIDFLITTKGKNTLKEDQSRNLCLEYLKTQKCDLIWVMDGDEVYTKNQIINIIDFIYKNPEPDRYSVVFKNFTFSKNLFLDYVHSRITWANRYGGIAYYYFDNEFIYNDDTNHKDATHLVIPKSCAFINHYPWLNSDIRSVDKIKYQELRYKGINNDTPEGCRSGYRINELTNKLEFNVPSWHHYNLPVPTLHEELTCFSTEFSTTFSRKNNRIDIDKVERDMNLEFQIYNGETEQLIYSTQMNLLRDVNFFISPSAANIYDEDENFYSFKIKVYENNRLIHNEKIYLKFDGKY